MQMGDYRRLLHRPSELEWALLSYTEANGALTAPDSALAQGAPQPLVGTQSLLRIRVNFVLLSPHPVYVSL